MGGRDARTNVATARIVRLIRRIVLKVAPKKIEAVFFHNGSHGAPPRARIRIEDTPVEIGDHMRYMGLYLDGR